MKRVWEILLRGRAITGRELEIIVGNLTFVLFYEQSAFVVSQPRVRFYVVVLRPQAARVEKCGT